MVPIVTETQNVWSVPASWSSAVKRLAILALSIVGFPMWRPALAADPFDGTYRGSMTAVKSKNPSNYVCPDIPATSYIVTHSNLVSPVANSSLRFEGKVAADGSFKTDLTWGSPPDKRYLEGVIQGNQLTGKFESAYCIFRINAERQ